MNNNYYWRGCEGIHQIWHGAWSDPELMSDGYVANYWEVENYLWYNFLEDHPEFTDRDSGTTECEDAFDDYCQDNLACVKNIIWEFGVEIPTI